MQFDNLDIQTVYAKYNGLDYANYFLAYTITVIVCRIIFAKFVGGRSPYATIAALLFVMSISILLFIYLGHNKILYILGAVLFGFPFIAGWTITSIGLRVLLIGVVLMAVTKCALATYRYCSDLR